MAGERSSNGRRNIGLRILNLLDSNDFISGSDSRAEGRDSIWPDVGHDSEADRHRAAITYTPRRRLKTLQNAKLALMFETHKL